MLSKEIIAGVVVLVLVLVALGFLMMRRRNSHRQKESFTSDPELKSMSELGGSTPVFLFVYAKWCPHCTSMTDDWLKLEEYCATTYGDKIKIKKVDSEGSLKDELPAFYKVKGFPTLLMIKGSAIVEYNGDRGLEQLKKEVAQNV